MTEFEAKRQTEDALQEVIAACTQAADLLAVVRKQGLHGLIGPQRGSDLAVDLLNTVGKMNRVLSYGRGEE